MLMEALAHILEHDGFHVITAVKGTETLALAQKHQPHCLIVDSDLEEFSGLQVFRALRQMSGNLSRLPILLTSTHNSESDRVRGLEKGADDYLVKPFGIRELRARIMALLRRAGITPTTALNSTLQLGPVHQDYKQQVLIVEQEDSIRRHELPNKECAVLRCLMMHAGDIVRRESLIECVWAEDVTTPPEAKSALDVYVRRLREKVEIDPANPKCIINVRSVGFTWSL